MQMKYNQNKFFKSKNTVKISKFLKNHNPKVLSLIIIKYLEANRSSKRSNYHQKTFLLKGKRMEELPVQFPDIQLKKIMTLMTVTLIMV